MLLRRQACEFGLNAGEQFVWGERVSVVARRALRHSVDQASLQPH